MLAEPNRSGPGVWVHVEEQLGSATCGEAVAVGSVWCTESTEPASGLKSEEVVDGPLGRVLLAANPPGSASKDGCIADFNRTYGAWAPVPVL